MIQRLRAAIDTLLLRKVLPSEPLERSKKTKPQQRSLRPGWLLCKDLRDVGGLLAAARVGLRAAGGLESSGLLFWGGFRV